MYKYILKVSMAEKDYPISDEFIKYFIQACEESNHTLNSSRNGRKFTYISRIGDDNMSIKVSLESKTEVIPTRAISSITRALLKSDLASTLQEHEYKGSVITASPLKPFEDAEVSFDSLTDAEVVQTVVEIFFGHLPSNNDKKCAEEAAKKIRAAVADYKANINPQ